MPSVLRTSLLVAAGLGAALGAAPLAPTHKVIWPITADAYTLKFITNDYSPTQSETLATSASSAFIVSEKMYAVYGNLGDYQTWSVCKDSTLWTGNTTHCNKNTGGGGCFSGVRLNGVGQTWTSGTDSAGNQIRTNVTFNAFGTDHIVSSNVYRFKAEGGTPFELGFNLVSVYSNYHSKVALEYDLRKPDPEFFKVPPTTCTSSEGAHADVFTRLGLRA